MKRYEYHYVALNSFQKTVRIIEELNRFGAEGWELVGIFMNQCYFKREIM